MKNKLNYFTSGIYFVNLIQKAIFSGRDHAVKYLWKSLLFWPKNAIKAIASNSEEAIYSKKAYDVFQYKLDHNKTDQLF